MCIYFGDTPDLTYKKREHIFPAGLGGTVTLPQGWVSDQANELFSSMEGELMHDSLLALDRYLFGPGDRRGKASKSNVTVGVQDDGKVALSYLSMGKPHLIDQVYLRTTVQTLTSLRSALATHCESSRRRADLFSCPALIWRLRICS